MLFGGSFFSPATCHKNRVVIVRRRDSCQFFKSQLAALPLICRPDRRRNRLEVPHYPCSCFGCPRFLSSLCYNTLSGLAGGDPIWGVWSACRTHVLEAVNPPTPAVCSARGPSPGPRSGSVPVRSSRHEICHLSLQRGGGGVLGAIAAACGAKRICRCSDHRAGGDGASALSSHPTYVLSLNV